MIIPRWQLAQHTWIEKKVKRCFEVCCGKVRRTHQRWLHHRRKYNRTLVVLKTSVIYFVCNLLTRTTSRAHTDPFNIIYIFFISFLESQVAAFLFGISFLFGPQYLDKFLHHQKTSKDKKTLTIYIRVDLIINH